MSALQERLLSLFALRPGQGLRTVLVASYLFLVVASYLVMKPASASLFLKKIGPEKLPYITIFIAALLGLFVSMYIRLTRRFSLQWVLGGSLLSCVLTLVGFWVLLQREVVWSYPLFSIWVGMYGVIATSQVWTLANELFTTREAKQVFGVIGAGGVLGGILGSYSVRFLAPLVGTVHLLLIAAGLLSIALILALWLVRLRIPARHESDKTISKDFLLDSLRNVFTSTHLRTIAGLVFITALATKIVDWQFSTIAEASFADGDSLSRFFGTFYGTAGVVGLVLQLFLTSRLLQRFGLGVAILIFPFCLALGTTSLLLPVAALAAAVFVRGSDAVLKHSLDRSTRELAFLPVPRQRKASAKSAIDMVVDRMGDGMAGLLQLGLIFVVAAFGGSLMQTVVVMAWVNLVIVAVWFLLALRLHGSYIEELKRSIASGRLKVGSWFESLAGADTVNTLKMALQSEDRHQILGALDVLMENPQWDLSDALTPLTTSVDAEIQARALALLLSPEQPTLPEGVTERFALEDQNLLRECLDLQLSEDPEERLKRAEAILDRAGGTSKGAWIALMVRRLGPEFRALSRTLLEALIRPESPTATRQVAATAIGMIPRREQFDDLLPPLLRDKQPEVAAAAARSASAIGSPELIREVIPMLDRAGTRRAARLALQTAGERSLPLIRATLEQPETPEYARRLPTVLAGISSAEASGLLIQMLSHPSPRISDAALRALYRMRLRDSQLIVAAEHLIPVATRLSNHIVELSERRGLLTGREAHPLDGLLDHTISRAEQQEWDLLFKTLALYLPPRRVLDSKLALFSDDPEKRANTVEFVEASLPRKMWLPVREALGTLKDGPIDPPNSEEVTAALMDSSRGEDPWIAACSLYWLLERGILKRGALIDGFRSHPSPLVREVLEPKQSGKRTMTVVEKVELLRQVDPFREIPPDQLAIIATLAYEHSIDQDQDIYRQGDPAGDLYVILEGELEVIRDGISMGKLGKGQAIGTWALLDEQPRELHTRTTTDCRFLKIDRGDFEDALDEHPEIARTLIRVLLRQVRKLAGAK